MHNLPVATWVELVLRHYCAQTNRLLASRPIAVSGDGPTADALRRALTAIGARLVGVMDDPDVVFDAGEELAERTQVADFVGSPRVSAAERIDFAARHMPVVASMTGRLAGLGRLDGLRVGLCLVLEPKTAVLALSLAGAGAEVSLFAHPEETDHAVVAELRRRGLAVFTDPDPQRQSEVMAEFLDQRLHLLIDDGSRVIRALVNRPAAAECLIGAAEETTSGLRPLRELGDQLPFPVLAVNDAGSKRHFDNAHGTGQSCLMTILDVLDPQHNGWPIAGRTVVVAGFGPVGEGLARHARALGAEVLVADPDPVARLRARFVGYRTGDLVELAAEADAIISASGFPHTIGVAAMRAARRGAAIAVAGGVSEEVDWAAALAGGARLVPVAEKLDRLEFEDGHQVLLLDEGGCINCTAGEGNPIEIMDLSFGVQLAALEVLLTSTVAPGVQPLPVDADRLVSGLGLASSFGEV